MQSSNSNVSETVNRRFRVLKPFLYVLGAISALMLGGGLFVRLNEQITGRDFSTGEPLAVAAARRAAERQSAQDQARVERPNIPNCSDWFVQLCKRHPEWDVFERTDALRHARETGKCEDRRDRTVTEVAPEPPEPKRDNPNIPDCRDVFTYANKVKGHNFIVAAGIAKNAEETGRCERKRDYDE
jgi:hypothetical protein